MSSRTEQLLREHSRSLRLIDKTLCCVIDAINDGAGNTVFLRGLFLTGDDEMGTLTIDSDDAGTYISIDDDGASGDITIDYNGGGDLPFSSPLILDVGDTILVKRTISTGDGWFKISGTF